MVAFVLHIVQCTSGAGTFQFSQLFSLSSGDHQSRWVLWLRRIQPALSRLRGESIIPSPPKVGNTRETDERLFCLRPFKLFPKGLPT